MMPKPSRSLSRGRSTTRHKTSPGPPPTKPPPARSGSRVSPTFPSRSGQKPTLYDAVAGHVTTHGLITASSYHIPSRFRDIPAHGVSRVLTPGEVLGGSRGLESGVEEGYAAHRFLVEDDEGKARVERMIEGANTLEPLVDGLQPGEDEERAEDGKWGEEEVQRLKARVKVGRLPDSDLLEAVHGFAGLFYEACGDRFDFRSLDETALLAFGVLLEETVRDELGEDGDLVFLEGVEDGERRAREQDSGDEVEESMSKKKKGTQAQRDKVRSPSSQSDTDDGERTRKHRDKRRKVDEDAQRRFGDDW